MELVIGDKAISTWSMRPWLVLKRLGVEVAETQIRLRQPDTADQARRFSPSAKVPLLIDGETRVWDSLAICEYLAERFPDAALWPGEVVARAAARSVCAEMHAGFPGLRGELSMDLTMRKVAEISEATQVEIRRVVQMWSGLRNQYGAAGPWLFGPWSIVDAYYTPVAARFRGYGVRLSDYGDLGAAGTYCERLLEQPDFLAWEAEAKAEEAAKSA